MLLSYVAFTPIAIHHNRIWNLIRFRPGAIIYNAGFHVEAAFIETASQQHRSSAMLMRPIAVALLASQKDDFLGRFSRHRLDAAQVNEQAR